MTTEKIKPNAGCMLSGEADTGIASAAATGSYPVLHSVSG